MSNLALEIARPELEPAHTPEIIDSQDDYSELSDVALIAFSPDSDIETNDFTEVKNVLSIDQYITLREELIQTVIDRLGASFDSMITNDALDKHLLSSILVSATPPLYSYNSRASKTPKGHYISLHNKTLIHDGELSQTASNIVGRTSYMVFTDISPPQPYKDPRHKPKNKLFLKVKDTATKALSVATEVLNQPKRRKTIKTIAGFATSLALFTSANIGSNKHSNNLPAYAQTEIEPATEIPSLTPAGLTIKEFVKELADTKSKVTIINADEAALSYAYTQGISGIGGEGLTYAIQQAVSQIDSNIKEDLSSNTDSYAIYKELVAKGKINKDTVQGAELYTTKNGDLRFTDSDGDDKLSFSHALLEDILDIARSLQA